MKPRVHAAAFGETWAVPEWMILPPHKKHDPAKHPAWGTEIKRRRMEFARQFTAADFDGDQRRRIGDLAKAAGLYSPTTYNWDAGGYIEKCWRLQNGVQQ